MVTVWQRLAELLGNAADRLDSAARACVRRAEGAQRRGEMSSDLFDHDLPLHGYPPLVRPLPPPPAPPPNDTVRKGGFGEHTWRPGHENSRTARDLRLVKPTKQT